MLKPAGYRSYAVGKWHVAPGSSLTPVGPTEHWPLGRGFDRYYGSLAGFIDEYHPELWHDNHRVLTPTRPGYHVSEDLADHAIEFVHDHVANAPETPFFLYLAFGACHAALHAPKDYVDRYRGAFDHGWDVEREAVFTRQRAQGVVPEHAVLAPRNEGVRAWDDLDADERQLAARLNEVFAGFLTHTDDCIDRVLRMLEDTGTLDDSIVVLMSDNGADWMGGDVGMANYNRFLAHKDAPIAESLAVLDELGGPSTLPAYPAGWAMAGNTPLKWYKRFTHGGGVRVPFVVRWPGELADEGGVRRQFHHGVDVVPTVLEALELEAPSTHHGIDQMPLHGVSMLPVWRDADAPVHARSQYFETGGHRGIWSDGFKAVTRHVKGDAFTDDLWELYDLDADFSESDDLAVAEPDRLQGMVELWWEEARRYGVLPLDDRHLERMAIRVPGSRAEREVHRFFQGMSGIPGTAAPRTNNRSFSITSTVDRPTGTEDGVLLAHGGRFSGWSLFVHDSRLCFEYNSSGDRTRVTSGVALGGGASTVRMEFTKTEDLGGDAVLLVDGHEVAREHLTAMIPYGPSGEGLYCGLDNGSPVSEAYEAPYPFAGTMRDTVLILGADEVVDAQARTRTVLAEQ
jgi:arylsulfatase